LDAGTAEALSEYFTNADVVSFIRRTEKKMTRRILLLGLMSAAPLAFPSNAHAVVTTGVVKNVPYVIAFRPINTQQHPYLGQMNLNFNNGIIQGTYTDISVRPGSPFANAHRITVTGGVTSSHVTLTIRQVTFRGTASGERMSGSTTIRGAIYSWEAHQGSPGSGQK
jgi:hypothetical protein